MHFYPVMSINWVSNNLINGLNQTPSVGRHMAAWFEGRQVSPPIVRHELAFLVSEAGLHVIQNAVLSTRALFSSRLFSSADDHR